MNKIKAAFLDRDGTLIYEKNYLSRREDIELLPKGISVARWCQEQGYTLFVVTNQSGIARGLFTEDFVKQSHEYLDKLLQLNGVSITKWYYCPHHPTEAVHERYRIDCNCRKPKPGMLFTAALECNIDLSQSIMVGDKQLDFDAGVAAGCRSFDIAKADISGKL